MKRAELQKFAKQNNIKANLKSETIIELLLQQSPLENPVTCAPPYYSLDSVRELTPHGLPESPLRFSCSPLTTVSAASERCWSSDTVHDSVTSGHKTYRSQAIGLDIEDLSISVPNFDNKGSNSQTDRDDSPSLELQYPYDLPALYPKPSIPYTPDCSSSSYQRDTAHQPKDEGFQSQVNEAVDSCLLAVDRLRRTTEELRKTMDTRFRPTDTQICTRYQRWSPAQESRHAILEKDAVIRGADPSNAHTSLDRTIEVVSSDDLFPGCLLKELKTPPVSQKMSTLALPGAIDVPGQVQKRMLSLQHLVSDNRKITERKRDGDLADDENRYRPRARRASWKDSSNKFGLK